MMFKRQFKLNKETKGTFRYEELLAPEGANKQPIAIGMLYIKKTVCPSPAPTRLEVTIDTLVG